MCQIQKHCSGLEVKLSPAGLQGSDVKSASLHLIAHPMGKVTSAALSAPCRCRDSCTLNLPLTFGPAGGGIHCPPHLWLNSPRSTSVSLWEGSRNQLCKTAPAEMGLL